MVVRWLEWEDDDWTTVFIHSKPKLQFWVQGYFS
jgi:hypothetical protein